MERYLTTKEFAALLKVSRQTIIKFVHEGCPHVSTTPGGQRTDYRFPVPEAEEWLKNRGNNITSC